VRDTAAGTSPIRVGFQVWGQHATWSELMATARAIERLGFDSLWANDHLFPAAGPDAGRPDAPIGPTFEAWAMLAGFAAVTTRIPLGVLVSAAAYRNIGVVVKHATGLDHLSSGRVTLGLGAGWHERDHRAFGLGLLPLGDRITRFEEQALTARRLLDGEEVTFEGRFVRMERAVNLPPPVGRMPLLIGGSGERRTLRIVARYADVWNGEGDPATVARRNTILDEHCRAIGRDPIAVRRTVGIPPIAIRASRDMALDALTDRLVRSGLAPADARETARMSALADTAPAVMDRLDAWRRAGAEEVIVDWPGTPDGETLERLAEARQQRG